jgi:hypothetical protein
MTSPTTAHVCTQCGASFPTEAQLREHVATVHRPPVQNPVPYGRESFGPGL